jgi:hypothetical protein
MLFAVLRILDILVRIGSGSMDLYPWPIHRSDSDPDPTPDPSNFVSDLQDGNLKLFFSKFFAFYFMKLHLHHFSKIKSHKKSQNRTVGIKVFRTIFA